MGRLSQLFWFLKMSPLPSKRERDAIFTHANVETVEAKRLRREYQKRIREENPEKEST